jgi:hypothetical protein
MTQRKSSFAKCRKDEESVVGKASRLSLQFGRFTQRMYLVPEGQHDRTVPPGQKPFAHRRARLRGRVVGPKTTQVAKNSSVVRSSKENDNDDQEDDCAIGR